MSGDYTRFGFDPLKRYSGVLMQQGRVQLDSDWNEEIDILKRRLRTTSLDVFGPVGVPYLTTPDAFLIGLSAGPPDDLTIEPGRLYVDGVQVEAFAGENATYLDQPFLPDPQPLPAGDSLVYLDIWEREVTSIEEPKLLDPALGGADTTTRTQTVWQVKVDGVDGAACGMDVGAPASAGRLTTAAFAPPTPDDPCLLPPASGYRGLENRLYRIEIQEPGPLGTARFKWSRDNGTIVSAVRAMATSGGQTTLTVNRIGRDQFMRFRIGDWVSLTDDHRELMGEAGEMAMVSDLDERNLRVVLDRALPTGGGRAFGPDDDAVKARHTRIQKWDQTATANPGLDPAAGLIATGAGPIAIEAGIEISFSVDPAGGAFNSGDYWVFWARTATAEIEILTAAPPRGIEHRYLQLAAITGLGGTAPVVSDCRPPPPQVDGGKGDCCCTFVVRPGENIQAAINALPKQGGCVCLKTGLHLIRAPLIIPRGSITLKAESPGTTVRVAAGGTALIIGSPSGGRVEGVDILGIDFQGSERASGFGIITVVGAAAVRIDHCSMEGLRARQIAGLFVQASDRVTVTGCRIAETAVGIWVRERCDAFVADGNAISALGRGSDEAAVGLAGIIVQQSAFPCRLTRNLVEGPLLGIVINDTPLGTPASIADRSIIADNLIDLSPRSAELSGSNRFAAIDCAADFCAISGNRIRLASPLSVGINLTGSAGRVSGNTVFAAASREADLRGPVGIIVGRAETKTPVRAAIVSGNHLIRVMHAMMLIDVEGLIVCDNIVIGAGSRGLAITGSGLDASRITGNSISGALSGILLIDGNQNRIAGNDIREGRAGITLARETGPAIDGNRLERLELWGIEALIIRARCEVNDNRLNRCGSDMRPVARGIGLFGIAGEAHVVGNEVMDTGSLAGADATSAADHGIAGDLILEARVANNLVTYSDAFNRDPGREDRALVMRGLIDVQLNDILTLGFAIQISGNKFIGTGRTALVELPEMETGNGFSRFERVTIDQNYLMHRTIPDVTERFATISLTGRAAIVTNNHVKATTKGYFSVNFNGVPGPFIGNVTTGGTLQHADFPAPINGFNMIGF